MAFAQAELFSLRKDNASNTKLAQASVINTSFVKDLKLQQKGIEQQKHCLNEANNRMKTKPMKSTYVIIGAPDK
jgi:hypothetical protein